jgi:carbon-monoxide dehydrogenase large subunit
MKAGAHPALAQGKVRYVGDHVAVVIADTYALAREAAEKVVVDYGVLPAIVDTATAAKAGAPVVHDVAPDNTVYDWKLGDKDATDAAFARAKHVTTLEIVNNRLAPNPMEPRAAVGEYDEGSESFTLYTTSQNPHVARLVLSAFIGIAPEHKLRVVAPDVGGATKDGGSVPAAGTPASTPGRFASLGATLARFASGLKMPGAMGPVGPEKPAA